jgi:hypothetical protein
MPLRNLKRVYHLDANRINARQKDSFVNQLEKWHRAKVIFLEMSRTAYHEAGHRSSDRSQKADEYTWISTNDSIGGEDECRARIERILFCNGAKNENQRNDILILFTAQRAGATLITADGASRSQPGGILGNARALADLGMRVLSAEAAVAEIRDLIYKRDEMARQVSARTGARLPRWVGRDVPDDALKAVTVLLSSLSAEVEHGGY